MVVSLFRRLLLVAAILAAAAPLRAESISLEVQSSSVERDRTTNEVVVTIELTPEGRTAFENFTQRNVGKNVEIRLGTTVLLRARLVERISGGIIRATTKLSDEEGRKVAGQLKRGTLIVLQNVEG